MAVLHDIARRTPPVRRKRPSRRSRSRRAGERSKWIQVKRAVWTRDGLKCRACQAAVDHEVDQAAPNYAHPHHILFRSQGGKDTTANVCTLCLSCHQSAHGAPKLEITGDADSLLTFQLDNRAWTSTPSQEMPPS